MPEYHVTWEIDLDADSPREAAESALAIHRNPDSIATVFDVTDEAGHTERVDLEDADGRDRCAACRREFEENETVIQAPSGKNYCQDCFDQGQG